MAMLVISKAVSAMKTALDTGTVKQEETMNPVLAAVRLPIAIRPPIVLPGRKPLVHPQAPKQAPAGSWPHYMFYLNQFMKCEWNMGELKALGKEGDKAAAGKAVFMSFVLNAVYGALVFGERQLKKRIKEENAQREIERREREAEEQELARKAMQNARAPKVCASKKPGAQPEGKRGPLQRLTVVRVQQLLKSETEKRGRKNERGLSQDEIKFASAQFVLGIVLAAERGEDGHTYTDAEVSALKGEVSLFVSIIFTAHNPLRGAQALEAAEQWMKRQLDPRARRDSERPAGDTLKYRLDLSQVL